MRKNYIDWLRNIGILFLFPYHTARVFNEGSAFYVKGDVNAFSSILVQLSYWFMPLLFLLAGASSFYALQRRSERRYLNERFSRLLIPLLFGVLVVVPPQAYYAVRFHRGYEGGYGDFLWSYFTDFSAWSEYAGGISPAHLWFILFLFLISIALIYPMRTVIRSGYAPGWMRRPLSALAPFAALAVLSFTPDVGGKNILVYAGYFILGFIIVTDDSVIDMLEKHRRTYLAMTLAGVVGILADGGHEGVVASALRHLVHWVTLLAILGYGKRYLNKGSNLLAYFNSAAFPLYILHQTYLVVVGYYVLRFADHGIAPFLLIMILSFALSLVTYELIRRWNPARVAFGLGRIPTTGYANAELPERS